MTRKTVAQRQAEDDWETVLLLPAGQRVLASIMRHAGLLDHSYTPGDVMGTAYAEGKRAVAIMIYSAATTLRQGAFQTALMAEVMNPADVRNAEPRRRDDTEPDTDE